MNFSVCPYCNQSYYNEQSHYCKQNISLEYASRGISNNFENPLQSQNNFHESSSFSIELRNPEVNLYDNIDNLNSGFLRHNQSLQDQAALHTNTENVNVEKSYEFPSFKSTFSKSRYQNINLGTPSELLNHVPEISNQNSSIPHIFHQADTSFAHIKTQNNLEAMQNGCVLVDKSSNLAFALKPALLSKQEELAKNCSFAVQQQKVIEKSSNTCISSLEDIYLNSSYAYGELQSLCSSKLNKHICPDCANELGSKATSNEHYEVFSDCKLLICDICQKDFICRITLNKNTRSNEEVFSIADPSHSQPFIRNINKKSIVKIQKSVANIASTVKDTHIPRSANCPCPGSSKVHSKKVPFICEICQREFMRKGNLKNHLLTHTEDQDPKKRSFICEICHRGFMLKQHLKRHLLTHTEAQDLKKR